MSDPYIDKFFRRQFGRRRLIALAGGAGAAVFLASCGGGSSDPKEGDATASSEDDPNVVRPAGWSDESHGNAAEPNFDLVFPANKVNKISISLPTTTWDAMLANMTVIAGARGTGGAGNGGFGGGGRQPGGQQGQFPGGQPPVGGGQQQVPGGQPPIAGGQQQIPGGGQGGPGGGMSLANPDWFPATVAFNGETWTNVGIRFKGNSTLRSSWQTGSDKMPFKLDFDQFEDEHPEIKNQRFHGFKQLSLSNNTGDASYIREAIAYDLFEAAGLPAANTALYEVTLDHGAGPAVLGLYTFIEVIDDTVIGRVFKDGTGNIYEADGQAASFAAGTNGAIEASFQAEGGEDPDWSDVKALYTAINAPTRTTDAAAWRKGLESVFDVDGFLEWLGIAAVIGHWDTYGAMTHNYYLYHDPSTKKMTWISWDHNGVLGAMGGGGGGGVGQAVPDPAVAAGGNAQQQARGGFGGMNTSLDKKDVGANWPLIRFLMDDPVYQPKYVAFMKAFMAGPFNASKLTARYAELQKLIAANVPAADAAGHGAAIQALTTWTQGRVDTVNAYLATA